VKYDSLIDKLLGDKNTEKHKHTVIQDAVGHYGKRQNIPFYINHFLKGTG
jgi:hypothetical protein